MGEWISKAANVFKRDVSETPQPFEIHCECGQKHAGIRRVRHQHLVCKSCGASLFALPHDTYPPPHLPKKSTTKRTKNKKKSSPKPKVNSIDLSPQPVLGNAISMDSQPGTGEESVPETFLELEDRSNFLVRSFQSLLELARGFVEVFWEFWTPYRKLALVIFSLLVLIAFYSIRQSQLRKAVDVVKVELEAGLEELNHSRWVEARQHFDKATAAVDLLGRTDLEANSIRQYQRETTALTRLTSISLIELMEIAEAYYIEHGAEEWQQKFETSYKAHWFIIEGYLRPSTASVAASQGYDLELVFPIAVGDKQRPVNVLVSFNLALQLPKVQTNSAYDPEQRTLAVFAGQIRDCSIQSDGNWIVKMDPATSFFWVNRSTYEATHLDTGSIVPLADQNQMFQMQGHWMGVIQ